MINKMNTIYNKHFSENFRDIEYPKCPIVSLYAHASSPCLEYNPKDVTCLVTGMVTGQISVFDIRSKNEKPSILSPRLQSHHDRVNAIAFYCSKTNMEFMSGSSAGYDNSIADYR